MRKFTLFLSLVVAFVTATAQEVTVTSLDQLSNDKTYFIESARCFLMNNTTANADGISTSNAKNLGTSTVAKDWNDANQQFKIENIDGNYYLYSVGAAKYVTKEGAWSETAVDALEITPSSNSTYNWKLCIAGNGMNSQEPNQMDAGIVVNSWTTEDPGNRYKIIDTEASTVVVVDYPNELTEFDQNKCYTASTTSRGGWAVKDDQFCSTVDAGLGDTSNPEDVNQQFAILSIDGENYYLYSVGAQKFVNSDKSLVAGIAEAIELADASKMGDCRVRVNFKGYSDKYINLGGSKQMEVNNWGTIDAGNAVAFIEAGEFDPTAALAMLQPATELQALEVASTERNPLETAINGQYKLQGVKINFNEVVKKYTTDLTGDYGYILDAEGNEVAKLNKCMGGNGTNNTFATPYSATAIETPGTYKVVVNPGVIFSADGTKEYKGGEFEFTVAQHDPVVTPSAEDGLCYNESFTKVDDFREFTITVQYATEVVLDAEKKVELKYIKKEGYQTVGEEVVAEATVTLADVDATTKEIKITFPEQEYAEGSYSFDIPAALFTVNGVANEVYASNTFTYKKPQLKITRDFDSWESYLDSKWYMPTAAMITIANAETVEIDETKVATIAVGESVYNSTLSYYYDDWSNAYYIELIFEDFLAEGFEFVKGDYTFTLPAGLYTVNGVANEEAVKTYTYGDPIVEEFSVTEILPAPGSTLESLDAISITFSNGMKPDMLPITCGEKTYYFIYMQGLYVAVDLMSYEPIVITEPGTYTLDLSELEGLTGDKVFSWTIAEVATALAVVSQTPAADEVVESFSSITIEFNKAIEFIQAAGGTGTDATGGTNGTDATGGTNGTTGGTDGTGGTGGTSGPAQYIKLKDANNGVVATAWVSAATIDGNKVTFVFEMNAAISKTGTYSFAIPAGLIKATDGEEFAGQTFTFQVEEPVKLAVVSQTPAADEVVESFSSITIEFNKAIEFIQAAGGTGTDAIGGTNGTDATGGTNGTTGGTDGTGGTGGTSGPAQYIKLKDANNGVVATAWVSAATIDGNKVTFVFEMNAAISKTGTYSFAIPAGLIKATDGEEFAGQTFTFQVEEPVKLAVVSQTPAADEVVESFSSITIEFNKAIEFIQAAGGTGTDATGGTNGTDATGGTNGTTGGTDGTGGTGGTSGPAQYIKLKDANNGVVATYWVSAATIDGATVTFVPEMNATISNPGTYTFEIPAGLIKATDGEEFAGETFTFTVAEPTGIENVDTEAEEDVIYDLSGRRIVEITKSGIYIVNGKKVYVK